MFLALGHLDPKFTSCLRHRGSPSARVELGCLLSLSFPIGLGRAPSGPQKVS